MYVETGCVNRKWSRAVVLGVLTMALLALSAVAGAQLAHASRINRTGTEALLMMPPTGSNAKTVAAHDTVYATVNPSEPDYAMLKATNLKTKDAGIARWTKEKISKSKYYLKIHPVKPGKVKLSGVFYEKEDGKTIKQKRTITVNVLKFSSPFKTLKIGKMDLGKVYKAGSVDLEQVVIKKNAKTKHYIASLQDLYGKTFKKIDLGTHAPSGKFTAKRSSDWLYDMGSKNKFATYEQKGKKYVQVRPGKKYTMKKGGRLSINMETRQQFKLKTTYMAWQQGRFGDIDFIFK